MIGAYYDTVFIAAQAQGLPVDTAADHAASAFLDGKPARQGKRKCSGADRHAVFWASSFLRTLPAQAWQQESLGLALARYLGQDRVACPDIVVHVARLAPDVLQQAARHAGLVLRQDSPRWREIEALADVQPEAFSEFVQVFRIFSQAHGLRVDEVEHLRQPLVALTPLDLLAYASLYAFEHLLPDLLEGRAESEALDAQEVWDAVENILAWKLTTCDTASLCWSDLAIAASLRQHLTPFLFPSSEAPGPRIDLYKAFVALLHAQIELNAFIKRSADQAIGRRFQLRRQHPLCAIRRATGNRRSGCPGTGRMAPRWQQARPLAPVLTLGIVVTNICDNWVSCSPAKKP